MMYKKAQAAVDLKLPHIAENGNSVLVGAKGEIYDIAKYWKERRDITGNLVF